jgi:hypothetical protein
LELSPSPPSPIIFLIKSSPSLPAPKSIS